MAVIDRPERPALEGPQGFATDGKSVPLSVLRSMHQAIVRALELLSGRLSLGSGVNGTHSGRVDGQWLRIVTPAAPNTTFAVPHGLGRVPVAYFVGGLTASSGIFIAPDRVWDASQIWLRCDVASVSALLLIV
jgi:hypothetical protein